MPAFLCHRPAADDAVGADVLIVPQTGSPHALPARLAALGRGLAEGVARAVDLGDFDGSAGSRFVLLSRRLERFPRVLLLGLGAEDEIDPISVRRAFAAAARDPLFERIDSVAIAAEPGLGAGAELTARVEAAVDGLLEGAYRWTGASAGRPRRPGRYTFLARRAGDVARIEAGLASGRAVGNAVLTAREMANTPANLMGPSEMAERAREIAKEAGLKAKVLGPAGLDRDRFVAMRAVGAGSPREPRLIVLEHDPGVAGPPIVLVGKGLVYDTGGLSLKPTSSMVWMKFDKCGGCAVVGAMRAVAALGLPVPVVGVVPAVENSVSGSSYRPGDVIGSRSGLTIDVQNTDAEGRVVLADALHWAIERFAPRAVVDIATLTGAAYTALGDHACAVLGNDDRLVERFREAGNRVGERAWPLPLWPEYGADLDSAFADVRNASAQGAGAIAGAAFLQRFVGEVPWVHLDVASVSRDRRNPGNGATGFGVRLIVEALRRWPKPRAKTAAKPRAKTRAKTRRSAR